VLIFALAVDVALPALNGDGPEVAQAAPANGNSANSITITTPAKSGTLASAVTSGATTEAGDGRH
jgi:hypothetical protein